jgi:hypothetical protein
MQKCGFSRNKRCAISAKAVCLFAIIPLAEANGNEFYPLTNFYIIYR